MTSAAATARSVGIPPLLQQPLGERELLLPLPVPPAVPCGGLACLGLGLLVPHAAGRSPGNWACFRAARQLAKSGSPRLISTTSTVPPPFWPSRHMAASAARTRRGRVSVGRVSIGVRRGT
eukprot:364889-Chlamydomonas_euryale.AAC.9